LLAEGLGLQPDGLLQFVQRRAFVLAERFAQQLAEQPDFTPKTGFGKNLRRNRRCHGSNIASREGAPWLCHILLMEGMLTQATRTDALKRLEVFIGEWRLGLGQSIPPPDDGVALSLFEWAFDGQFLVQRTEIPDPKFPDNLSIVAYDPETDAYTQHYFDSRGVVRLYAMRFRDGIWTLMREKPDFSPLDFKQRFTGRFSTDANAIFGTWEIDRGSGWMKDFDLTYARKSR
jgi:hypothetical protein